MSAPRAKVGLFFSLIGNVPLNAKPLKGHVPNRVEANKDSSTAKGPSANQPAD